MYGVQWAYQFQMKQVRRKEQNGLMRTWQDENRVRHTRQQCVHVNTHCIEILCVEHNLKFCVSVCYGIHMALLLHSM